MPRRCIPSSLLLSLLQSQDQVIHRDQAREAGLTADAVRYRLRSSQWAELLPSVYLARPGDPTRRQMLVGALLYAGPGSQIDGADACRFHGIRAIALDEQVVYVTVPQASRVRSTRFVVIRRSSNQVVGETTARLRYVDAATAVIAATRTMSRPRAVLAAFSDALQRNVTTYDELHRAHLEGPPRNSRLATEALRQLGAGALSVAEADFQRLATTSAALPRIDYNVWLRLRCGRLVCVDALIRSSALVHEVNGRIAHAREDLFEDMQERHDALTASGFTVLHNSPRRIRQNPREVLSQVEQCHQIYDGRGMPNGVEALRSRPSGHR
jgi:hypothetical protein